MKKQPEPVTKNEQVFKQIEEYQNSLDHNSINISGNRIYKGEGVLRNVKEGARIKYTGRFATCWLTKEEIQSINNVAAYRIILEILADLEFNNPLWRRRDEKKNGRWSSQNNAALKILEKHEILLPFRGTDVYYVFPTKLGCGHPFFVALAWNDYVKNEKITPNNIGSVNIVTLKNPKDKTPIKSDEAIKREVLEQLSGS